MPEVLLSIHLSRQKEPRGQGYTQTFVISADLRQVTVLDLLQKIQAEQDSSLVFRCNCRNAICGSCAIKINGKSALACAHTAHEVMDERGQIAIAPLGNLPVVRDLVVDMTKFWQNLALVDPFVATKARQVEDGEFLQTPQQRLQLQAAGNCILCGACYSECNALQGNSNFVGPHALAKVDRILQDNREQNSQARLDRYNHKDMVWGCTRCYQCNEVCPVAVQPLDRITAVRQAILQARHLAENTAMIHRRAIVELVKEGGWLEESKLAVQVLSDRGRRWQKLMKVIPLTWKMLKAGKLPWRFRASSQVPEIKNLIQHLENKPQSQIHS